MRFRVADAVVLVTGANRGVGRSLVEALLERGVPRVYAGARDPATLAPLRAAGGGRVVPLRLDITDDDQVRAAADAAGDVTMLINNAGILIAGPALESGRENLQQHLDTNLLGTFAMIRAFVPVLTETHGDILNVLSLQSMAGSMGLDGYSVSKAASYSLMQSMRPALAVHGIAIAGAYPGGIDTDMLKDLDAPKSAPDMVAHGILDGLEAGRLEIFPDPVARLLGDIWEADPRRYEGLFARTDELVAVLESAQQAGSLTLV
jgi:NAD(P)-dependent dehydrogenase (short-subunit alcohol dehydrogenase family)